MEMLLFRVIRSLKVQLVLKKIGTSGLNPSHMWYKICHIWERTQVTVDCLRAVEMRRTLTLGHTDKRCWKKHVLEPGLCQCIPQSADFCQPKHVRHNLDQCMRLYYAKAMQQILTKYNITCFVSATLVLMKHVRRNMVSSGIHSCVTLCPWFD